MRGIAGLLFVFLGLVMGYMVLSGKFPSSGTLVQPPVNTPGNELPTSTTSNSFVVGGTQHATGHGFAGLPTMGTLNDLVPSNGGYQP